VRVAGTEGLLNGRKGNLGESRHGGYPGDRGVHKNAKRKSRIGTRGVDVGHGNIKPVQRPIFRKTLTSEVPEGGAERNKCVEERVPLVRNSLHWGGVGRIHALLKE